VGERLDSNLKLTNIARILTLLADKDGTGRLRSRASGGKEKMGVSFLAGLQTVSLAEDAVDITRRLYPDRKRMYTWTRLR
jgi:hypothetical protein